MNYQQIIAHYTTQEAAGKAIGVGQSTVANWKRRGVVPALAQLRYEIATSGKLRADKASKVSQL